MTCSQACLYLTVILTLFDYCKSSLFSLDAASQNQCRIEIGAWSSLCAVVAFFISSVIICFFNQFEPFFGNRCSRSGNSNGDINDHPTDDDVSDAESQQPPSPTSSAENEELTMDSAINRTTTVDTGDARTAADESTVRDRDPPEERANEEETYLSGDDYTEVKTNPDMEDTTMISSYPSETQDGYESETTYNTPKNTLDDIIDAAVAPRSYDRYGNRDSNFFDICCADPFQHVESMKIRKTPKRKRYPLNKGQKYTQRVHFGP